MNIGLLGFGVVGGGVWELAQENRALNVKKVLVRREAPSLGKAAVQDVEAILRDTDIDTVVEVLGGLHPAYEWICRALAAGKNVVTANKAVISAYYRELTALAHENGAALRCTAAVGGGIPWLVNLQRCRRVDTVTEVGGIMNGTTNFIMDAMARQGSDFPAVLQRAQELGYAEADPSADIDGDDIRRKLTISANIAFDALLRRRTSRPSASAPSPGRMWRTSGLMASPASCWPAPSGRRRAWPPMWSLRWWRRASRRRRCRGTITSSPAPGSCWAARATSGREPDGIPRRPTWCRTAWIC